MNMIKWYKMWQYKINSWHETGKADCWARSLVCPFLFGLLETLEYDSIPDIWQTLTDYTLTLWHTLEISTSGGPNSCHGPKVAPLLRARAKNRISQPPNSKSHWAWLIQHIHNHYMLSRQHSWCRLRSTQQSGQVSSSIHSWNHHEITYNYNLILPCNSCNMPRKIPEPRNLIDIHCLISAIVRDPSWRASSARFPIVVGLAFCDAFATQYARWNMV